MMMMKRKKKKKEDDDDDEEEEEEDNKKYEVIYTRRLTIPVCITHYHLMLFRNIIVVYCECRLFCQYSVWYI